MRYKIPRSWADITVEQFQEINRLNKADELDYLINLVSVLCHLDVDTVEAMTIVQLRAMGEKMAFISKMPDKFINEFKLNGKHYTIDCNIAHISTGQYIDMGKYIEQGADDNLHKLLTVFCFPTYRKWFKRKPMKYGVGYSINALAEEFKQVPFDVAYPLAVFFCELLDKSMPIITDYLQKQMMSLKNMEEQSKEKALKSTGAGSQ